LGFFVFGDENVPRPTSTVYRGEAAHLDPDGLVVALPVALSGTVTVTLAMERSEISYGDDATVAG
jgi:hypothetical protein